MQVVSVHHLGISSSFPCVLIVVVLVILSVPVFAAGPWRVLGLSGPHAVALSAPAGRYLGYPRRVGMQGHHVAVYSAPLPWPLFGGRIWEPGFVYFSGTSALASERYAVHTQFCPTRYPALETVYHGEVGAMTEPLPQRPKDYELCRYYGNDVGTVDCYLWRPGFPTGMYLKYEVVDIHDPADWARGAHYVRRGAVAGAPVGRRACRVGLRRFYARMRPAD